MLGPSASTSQRSCSVQCARTQMPMRACSRCLAVPEAPVLEALSNGAITSSSSLRPHMQFSSALHGSKNCQHGPQAPSSVVLRSEPSWPAVFGGRLCLATCRRYVTVLGAGGDPVVQGGHAQPTRPGWPRHTRPSRCARISLAGVMDGAAKLHACCAHSKLENPCTSTCQPSLALGSDQAFRQEKRRSQA